jgi:hypothetical protein
VTRIVLLLCQLQPWYIPPRHTPSKETKEMLVSIFALEKSNS